MKPVVVVGALRVAVGVSLLGSVAWQIIDRVANDLFRPTEYLAYFSIVASIAAGIVLVASGVVSLRQLPESTVLTIARLTAAVSMIVVGVVYHALIGDDVVDPRDVGYAWPVLPNLMIHTVAPVLIALDYVVGTPGRALRLRQALWVAVFPLTWLAVSVVRGLVDGWWPYWFIDPNGDGGVAGMLAYVLAIAVFFVVLGFVLIALSRALRRS